ncbi:MAG: IclR family transcriptional regulator [Chloroflexota bacterium]|nr:IclR family transcriptional regulator [Chloroflexota bacterium]
MGRNATSDRTLDFLMLFDEQHPVRSATEVARLLHMARSTTYRYLQTLRSYGLIEEHDSRGYRLGSRILELARAARAGLGLSELALPVMRRVSEGTGEAVLLTRRSGASVVCVERVDSSPHRVRLAYERGHVMPIHAGASAKILLAFAEPAEIDRALDGASLTRFTSRTVTDPKRLRRQLADIRVAGHVVTDGEVDEGVRGVAAPIFDPEGRIAAGLSVAGPAYRIDDARVGALVRAVREGAAEITTRLRDLEV